MKKYCKGDRTMSSPHARTHARTHPHGSLDVLSQLSTRGQSYCNCKLRARRYFPLLQHVLHATTVPLVHDTSTRIHCYNTAIHCKTAGTLLSAMLATLILSQILALPALSAAAEQVASPSSKDEKAQVMLQP